MYYPFEGAANLALALVTEVVAPKLAGALSCSSFANIYFGSGFYILIAKA